MAINIQISTGEIPLLSNELIYIRKDKQTPLDTLISFFENGLEDLFQFYSDFGMESYNDFYFKDKFRILKEMNAMTLNQFESATRADDSLYANPRGRIYGTEADVRTYDGVNIRIYK